MTVWSAESEGGADGWTEAEEAVSIWTESPSESLTLGWGSAWGGFGWGTAEPAEIWTEESV